MPLRPQINSLHRLPRGGGNCDFCGVYAVAKLYACKNFTFAGQPVFDSDIGRWAACHNCSGFISESRWIKLSNRVMREVEKRKGVTPVQLKDLRRTLLQLHKHFGAHVIKGEDFGIHTARYRGASAGA